MAGDTIGNLVAIVKATADQFSTDVKEINGTLDQLKEHAEHAGKGVTQAFEIGAAVELFHQGIEQCKRAVEGFLGAIEGIGQLKRFSEEIGATTQQIQELRYVAAQFHVTSEDLDGALVKMQKNIGELNAGGKGAVEVFERLGLTARDFAGLSASESFTKIGEAIRKLGNASDEVDNTLKIFGKGAAELVNVFDAGAAAAAKYQQEARELGMVLSNEDVAAAEGAETAMRQLHLQWQTFVNHLAVEAAPVITAIANELKLMAKYATEHAAEIAHAVIEWTKFVAEIVAMVVIVPKVIEGINFLVQAFKALASAEAVAEAFSGPGGLAALAAAGAAAGLAVLLINSQFEKLDAEAQGAIENAKKFVAETEKQSKATASNVEQSKAAVAIQKELNKELEKVAKRGAEVEKSLRTPMEKFKDEIREYKELLDASAISWETFSRGAAKAIGELDKLHKGRTGSLEKTPDIGAADATSTEGFNAILRANRLASDLAQNRRDLEQQQFEESQRHTQLLQQIADQTGGGSPSATSTTENVAEF